MSKIININFNFNFLEDLIVELLKQYNICKDDYFNGVETSDNLSLKVNDLIEMIDSCDECIMIRKKVIDGKLIKENSGECEDIRREKLVDESKYLSNRLCWHKNLKESIIKESNQIINGEAGFGEEPESF